ncbi:MAG: hypothetical protein H0U67_12650 [Gemmatimonadetes bacterium]|nr:hypothetical protein [Gemmatimonadota bacterium]
MTDGKLELSASAGKANLRSGRARSGSSRGLGWPQAIIIWGSSAWDDGGAGQGRF